MLGSSRVLPWRCSWLIVLGLWLIAGATLYGRAQEGADDEPFLTGLVASFQDAKGNTASRIDHQLAFHWDGASPDPRLAEGEFRATWQGHLFVRTRGDYRFFLFGSGEVELKVAGRAVVAR